MMPLLRILALVGWASVVAPMQALALLLKLKAADRIPCLFHWGIIKIFGIQIETAGEMSEVHPTLFVSNHISYLDIFVFGAVIEGSFVAKSDIASWPVAGWLARLQRTIFVEREQRTKIGAQRTRVQERFESGGNVILFPEGTSYDGARVLNFKSALFSVAQNEVNGRAVTVQPMSLAYTEMDGLPLTRAQRPMVAWYGDMALLPHIWTFLKARRTKVEIQFHAPVSMDDFANRRAMAAACQAVVSAGVRSMNSGRTAAGPALPAPDPALAVEQTPKQAVGT
jgi:1-acyl-sn-glycerol-3-phosphate acyltransferase